MNNIDLRILVLECSIRVFMIRAHVCFILSMNEYVILNVLLECIELFLLYNLFLYELILLLESIDLILAHYAGIMSPPIML